MALSVAEKGMCLENLSHPRLLEGGARREAVGGVERSETVFQAYTLRRVAFDESGRDVRSEPGMTELARNALWVGHRMHLYDP